MLKFFWKPFCVVAKQEQKVREPDRTDVGVDMREQRAGTQSRRTLLKRCAAFGAGTFFSSPFHQQMGAVVWGEQTSPNLSPKQFERTYTWSKKANAGKPTNYAFTETPKGMDPSKDPLKRYYVSSTETLSIGDREARAALELFDMPSDKEWGIEEDDAVALAPKVSGLDVPSDASPIPTQSEADGVPASPQIPRSFSETPPASASPPKMSPEEYALGGLRGAADETDALAEIAHEIHDETKRKATEVGFNTALLVQASDAAKKNDSMLSASATKYEESKEVTDECARALQTIKEKNCCRQEQNKLITEQCQKLCSHNRQTQCVSGGRAGRGNWLRWLFIGLLIAFFIVMIVMMFTGGGGAALGSVAFF